jgi:hypothetical protein
MKQYPELPDPEDAPAELFESGHLWLLEKVDGAHLRFQLQPSGLIRFGDRKRVYDDADSIPEPYDHAVRHVRTRLDRDALRAAVDDVTNVVFFGEAMHQHAIDYDWERTPSFLGFDVWSEQSGAFRPPGAAQGIFQRLGLTPVNAFERELPARDFDPDSYTVAQSEWYDGPAEGVVVRNKRGQRAKLLAPEFRETDEPVVVDATATELAASYATTDRFRKHARDRNDRSAITVEELYDAVLSEILRENHRTLFEARDPVDMREFRSAVAERTRSFLEADTVVRD